MAKSKKHTAVPSEAKSKIAYAKERINGRFVSNKTKTDQPKETVLQKEEDYKITEEDRARFGSDSKAFFEWALTKAATRYEAAKYAKELMRFQYPSLQSMEVKQEVDITETKVLWMWTDPQNAVEHIINNDDKTNQITLQTGKDTGGDTQEPNKV